MTKFKKLTLGNTSAAVRYSYVENDLNLFVDVMNYLGKMGITSQEGIFLVYKLVTNVSRHDFYMFAEQLCLTNYAVI